MLKDVQGQYDDRNITLDEIGICDYKLPFVFVTKTNSYNTVGTIRSTVKLCKNQKGAHLSRIIETLNKKIYCNNLNFSDFEDTLSCILKSSEVNSGNLGVEFDIIISDITPVSHKKSFSDIHIKIYNKKSEQTTDRFLEISLVGTTLCPCSKEISLYGAHNQRCKLIITIVNYPNNIELEDVINLIQSCFSAKVYGTVKRVDEKYLTENAYNNPKFSEDLIRDVLLKLEEKYKVKIVAELKNYESIHPFNVCSKGELEYNV